MATKTKASTKKKYTVEALLVAYIIIALAVILAGAKVLVAQKAVRATVDQSSYQAVFLSNGQLYFGRLSSVAGSLVEIRDAYTLQDSTPTIESSEPAQQQFSVVAVTQDFHQPTDVVVVNKEHILYWQNLDKDSRVVEAIARQKEN